ncbi:MAG TPA: UDP-N-acetylmuramoyl-L-alanine--D-glutamate ligase [Candidatus Limnocylindria bacterium]
MSGPSVSRRIPASRSDLAGRRALVLGLARSGVAAARFLADAGATVTVYDRRPADELAEAVAALEGRPVRLALGVDPAELGRELAGSDLVVTSPSVSARFPTTEPWLRDALVETDAAGIPIVSEVDLFLRLTRARILAVTGTKGKTTTSALTAAILAAGGIPHALGGNIGTPLIEDAERMGPDTWAVLELSELQLPTLSRGVDIAVYTNVLADHLDRHGTVEAYRAVKRRLADLSAAEGVIVLNHEDPGCAAIGASLPKARVHWYGLEPRPGADAWIEDGWVVVGGERVLPRADVPLRGDHLLRDTLAAAVGARLVGADTKAVAAGIRSFAGVPHRLEPVGVRDGIEYVNDSQATIPLAAMAALGAFDDRGLVVIAGGQGKGLTYDELADAIAVRCRAAVLIGETADELETLLAGRLPVVRSGSMDEAVDAATAAARPGDVVLLAPAAASFDMFVDYAARGDAFRRAVAALPEPEASR